MTRIDRPRRMTCESWSVEYQSRRKKLRFSTEYLSDDWFISIMVDGFARSYGTVNMRFIKINTNGVETTSWLLLHDYAHLSARQRRPTALITCSLYTITAQNDRTYWPSYWTRADVLLIVAGYSDVKIPFFLIGHVVCTLYNFTIIINNLLKVLW